MATMNMDVLLAGLKTDLGFRTEVYDERLADRLTEAQERLTAEGITLKNTVRDRDLVIMYAAWLWLNRIDGAPMPRMLVIARNNRLFGQKAQTEETET